MIAAAQQVAVELEMREAVQAETSRLPAKVIAFRCGRIPERTVQNWQQGKCLPSAFHWEMLKQIFPALDAKSREWHARSLGLDPSDDTRLISELHRALTQRLAATPNGGGGK